MKVILNQDVPKVGAKNEIVELAHGYAKNFIIKNNYGVEATKANLYKLDLLLQNQEQDKIKLNEIAKINKAKLEQTTFQFAAKASGSKMFGSISTKQIVEKLKEEGIDVDKRTINLETPINTLGYHEITIDLTKEIKATFKIQVVAIAK